METAMNEFYSSSSYCAMSELTSLYLKWFNSLHILLVINNLSTWVSPYKGLGEFIAHHHFIPYMEKHIYNTGNKVIYRDSYNNPRYYI